MKALAEFVLSGRYQAIAVILTAGLLGLVLPPLILLSGAMLALIGLRQNLIESLLVWIAGVGVCAAMAVAAGAAVYPALGSLMVFWVSVLLLAIVLKRSGSLAYMILSGMMLGILLIALMYVQHVDPAVFWKEKLLQWPDLPVLQKALEWGDAEMATQLELISQAMTGVLAIGLCTSSLLALFLGRWLQALLLNPGGFQREFHALRMGSALALLAIIAAGVAMLSEPGFWNSAAVLCIMPFFFQGLAVMHALVNMKKWHTGWLVLLYVMLFMSPAMLLLVILLGLVDAWLDLRTRASVV